jgi:hypothetical protein
MQTTIKNVLATYSYDLRDLISTVFDFNNYNVSNDAMERKRYFTKFAKIVIGNSFYYTDVEYDI